MKYMKGIMTKRDMGVALLIAFPSRGKRDMGKALPRNGNSWEGRSWYVRRV